MTSPFCTPEECPRRFKVCFKSLRRYEQGDPDFPLGAIMRLSRKRVLIDVPRIIEYLRGKGGKAPTSIRGDAEEAAKPQQPGKTKSSRAPCANRDNTEAATGKGGRKDG